MITNFTTFKSPDFVLGVVEEVSDIEGELLALFFSCVDFPGSKTAHRRPQRPCAVRSGLAGLVLERVLGIGQNAQYNGRDLSVNGRLVGGWILRLLISIPANAPPFSL